MDNTPKHIKEEAQAGRILEAKDYLNTAGIDYEGLDDNDIVLYAINVKRQLKDREDLIWKRNVIDREIRDLTKFEMDKFKKSRFLEEYRNICNKYNLYIDIDTDYDGCIEVEIMDLEPPIDVIEEIRQ